MYTREFISPSATHQLSLVIVSKGYSTSGWCMPSKNQNFESSNSRRSSLKR